MSDDHRQARSYAELLRWELEDVAHRVRHPALPLVSFTADLPDDDGDDLSGLERGAALLRRAALLLTAVKIIDRCIWDLQEIKFDEDGQPTDETAEEAEDSFVYEYFPPRHRKAYDDAFFRKVLVSVVRVADDLADPEGGYAACTAEEIIRHAIGEVAGALCDAAGLGRPWADPDEMLLEDLDFQFLYDRRMDGIENDPGMQARLGLDVPPVSDWFAPFNPDRVVHPYAETERSGREAHDLQLRLDGEMRSSGLLRSKAVDDAAPIGSFAATSEVVALARRAAGAGEPGLWVADDSDRERSFDALTEMASSVDAGNGWLEWEPYENADTVRTDLVTAFVPHRHFPVGDDEPWVSAAVGGTFTLAIPLRVVVSYRPDPDARRRWQAGPR